MCVASEKAMLKKPQTLWVDVSLLLVNIIHMCAFVYIHVHVNIRKCHVNDSVDVAYSVSTSFICIFTYPCTCT